ncbi:MAG TPA: serine acetyltransferase [Candidatus Dormibacteraeota bacterium]|nr:serine acetyltransferase [Candidatus Dormibacteraeota bacterium]
MIVKSNLPYYLYRTANTLYRWKIPVIPFLIQQFLRFVFSCFIPYKTRIGTKNIHFGHNGLGVVLDYRCVIGNDVRIDQQVTIGIRWDEQSAPIIGNNVRIGAGAKVLGSIRIGNNARIGANAVVLTDVPDGATAVGVPARILLKRENDRGEAGLTKTT